MAEEGAKKRDIQRQVQKVHTGSALSSENLDSTKTNTKVEIGFPAEKITLVTTGDLAANVTPKIGSQDSNAAISASNSPNTTTTGNLFSSVEIARTSGSGKVLILAK